MSADQSQNMSSTNAIANDKSDAPRRERRNRRSLLDHLVNTVVTNFSKPELERELSFPPTPSSTSKDTAAARPQANASTPSLWGSTNSNDTAKSIELQDLRIDNDDEDDASISSTGIPDLVSSFSSSWHKTRSHLVFAEEIIASLEREVMAQDDPFAKDPKFTVGSDGLITLSSLLSDAEEISSSRKTTRRSRMNTSRAA